jgi:hypothetical protein
MLRRRRYVLMPLITPDIDYFHALHAAILISPLLFFENIIFLFHDIIADADFHYFAFSPIRLFSPRCRHFLRLPDADAMTAFTLRYFTPLGYFFIDMRLLRHFDNIADYFVFMLRFDVSPLLSPAACRALPDAAMPLPFSDAFRHFSIVFRRLVCFLFAARFSSAFRFVSALMITPLRRHIFAAATIFLHASLLMATIFIFFCFRHFRCY